MEPFTAEHAKNAEEKRPEKSLPLMNADHTDYTDRRGLPRINADERGLEQEEIPNLVRMRCEAEVLNGSTLGQSHAKLG